MSTPPTKSGPRPERWATSVTRDPALRALLAAHDDYPGPVAILDAADRAWLRDRGVDVPDRAPAVPLTERARRARVARAGDGGAKKKRAPKTL